MTSSNPGQTHEYALHDPEMVQILEEMLERDEKITARGVVRKHPGIAHASSITRSPARSELIAAYQAKQAEIRRWQARVPKRSRDQLASQLANKDLRIAELERQVEILRVSHIAMMRTVGELGGLGKLLKLYESYRGGRAELGRLGLLPRSEVLPINVQSAKAD